MKNTSRERWITAANFIVVIYFLLVYLLHHYSYSNFVLEFIQELLSIPFLIVSVILMLLGAVYLFKYSTRLPFIMSYVLLCVTLLLIVYSFITY